MGVDSGHHLCNLVSSIRQLDPSYWIATISSLWFIKEWWSVSSSLLPARNLS